MSSLLRDLRLAVRVAARKPGVTTLAILSLGLAIGFSTAAFSVLDAYALRDLAVRDPAGLASVDARTRERRPDSVSWIEYQALATRSRSFVGLIAEDRKGPKVALPDRDDFPITAGVSDNYFDVLGVRAVLGDVFHAGRGQGDTVVITHRYWTLLLNSDPAIIGRTLRVGRATLRIVGVLTPGFTGTNRGLLVDLFVPPQTFFGALRGGDPNDRLDTSYELTGRLQHDISLDQARAEADGILRQVFVDGRAPAPERRAAVAAFADSGVSAKLQSNALVLGVVVLLIVIAAANLANLRLVDNEYRRHETSIRLALGAARGDLARQHLIEALLLSGLATLAGLLIARWLIGAAPALLYAGNRYTDYGIRLDARTFAFSSAVLLVVALVGALIPLGEAWRHRTVPVASGIRLTRSTRLLGALVVAQVAIVTGVACSAALLWRSLENVAAIRPAMDPDRPLLLVEGSFTGDESAIDPRAEALAGRLDGVPGVDRVAWARRAMLSGSGGGAVVNLDISGQPRLAFPYNTVSASYFATTGGRVLSGRAFANSDAAASTPVVLVNQTFVRRFFPDREPIGEWIRVAGKDRQIVGIVEDGPQDHLLEEIQPFFYFPFAQMPDTSPTFLVLSRTDPALVADATRAAMRSADSSFTIRDMITMRQHMRGARADQQVAADVTGGLASVGLLLAAAGLFGVTLFAVSRRTHEFGVRLAIGATPGQLARQVLREAAGRVSVALPLGWALAFTSRHALENMLYGVASSDPWTFAGASIVVALVGAVAALHPALRAAGVDAVAALRPE